MIRGKSIEEALRFFLENRKKFQLSLKDIQEYALDYYFLRTNGLYNQIIKKHSMPIKSLVRAGVNGFSKIITQNSSLIENSTIDVDGINKFPDFLLSNLLVDQQLLRDCLIELKIVEKNNFHNHSRYQRQALSYAIHSNKPVLLMYLITESKIIEKQKIFQSFPKFLKIFPKKFAKFD